MMKKDIEWLKKEISKRDKGTIYTCDLMCLINNLDEPEVTYEQVVEWIENNEFYCHVTAETVLENAVDKGELGYYGTKYSVVEKPVIPKFVAEWIAKHRDIFDLYPALRRLESNSLTWDQIYKWYRENTHEFVNAYLTGEYEVEEEPLYYALIKGHELIDSGRIYWIYDKIHDDVFISELHSPDDNFLPEMSKKDWGKHGINDSNADFVKVDEEWYNDYMDSNMNHG